MRRVLLRSLAVRQALAKAIFWLFNPHTIWGTSRYLTRGDCSPPNPPHDSGSKRVRMTKTIAIKKRLFETTRTPKNLKCFFKSIFNLN
ncbi:hypothetical protein HanPI659440_Chr11g0402211 [Helianthus annuus]|nr:hypothetical protein HanPI659440_Chr11g0402211 [Helianthus annuus]